MADDLEVKARISGDASGYINAVNQARAALSAFATQNQNMISVINATRNSTNSMVVAKQNLVVASRAGAVAVAQGSTSLRTFGSVVKDMLSGNGLPGLIARFGGLAAAGGAIYKLFSVGRALFSKLISDYNKLGDSIYGLKLVTGDTTEQTSEFLYVANVMGVSSLSLQMRLAQMAKHLVDNHKWIRALGVEYRNTDGSVKPTVQTFFEIADSIRAMSDSEKREASAMAVYGRGYKDILPMLALTKQQRQELIEQAKQSGAVWSDEDLKKQRELMIGQRMLHAALQQLGATIARAVTPYLLGFFNTMRDVVSTITSFVRGSKDAQNALKGIGLIALTIVNPFVGLIAILTILVQRVEPFGEAFIAAFTLIGDVSGKAVSTAAMVMKDFLDVMIDFASGVLQISQIVTGTAIWKGLFGTGASDSADKWLAILPKLRSTIDSSLTKLQDIAWDKGSEFGKNFSTALVEIMKKLKLKKSDINLGFPEGEGFDPSPGGGGGGKRKTKLQQYFESLVKQSREVVETLRDNAIKAKKEMKDLADKTAEDFRKAMSLDTIAKDLGGAASPTRLIAMFQKRLGQMKNFVANIKTLRALGLPAEMLADLANMGMIDGARMAQMLVSNPSAIPQLRDIQAQITAATQEAGTTVSEAVMGQRVMDAIGAAVGAQNRFGDLLGQSGKFGYNPSKADIDTATANITQQVMMSVQSNADPAVIEQAVAWALKTGIPMYAGIGGRGGAGGGGGYYGMPGFMRPAGPMPVESIANQRFQQGQGARPGSGLQGPTGGGRQLLPPGAIGGDVGSGFTDFLKEMERQWISWITKGELPKPGVSQ